MKRVRDLSAQSLGMLTAQLRSVPRKLFAICILQIIVLVAGIFISRPKATCDIVHIAHSHYGIDCNRCHPTTGLYFGEFLMILGGVSVIGVGIYASVKQSMQACKIYGIIMLIYAFVIGLSAVLSFARLPTISRAISKIDAPSCITVAHLMFSSAELRAVFYLLNCLLDVAGALYAIWSKQFFEYQTIEEEYRQADEYVNTNL